MDKWQRPFEDRVRDESLRVFYEMCPLNRKERRTARGKLLEQKAKIAALEKELEMYRERDGYGLS